LYFVDKVIYGRKILRQTLGKAGKLNHDRVISWCYISDVPMFLIRHQVSDRGSFNDAFPPPFKSSVVGLKRVSLIWLLSRNQTRIYTQGPNVLLRQ